MVKDFELRLKQSQRAGAEVEGISIAPTTSVVPQDTRGQGKIQAFFTTKKDFEKPSGKRRKCHLHEIQV